MVYAVGLRNGGNPGEEYTAEDRDYCPAEPVAVESIMQMKKISDLARRQLSAAYVGMGKVVEARAVIDEFLEHDPDYSIEN